MFENKFLNEQLVNILWTSLFVQEAFKANMLQHNKVAWNTNFEWKTRLSSTSFQF